jgi:hypothetical protein
MPKRYGGSMNGMEVTPGRKQRQEKARRREEARWAARSGPVEVRRVGEPVKAAQDPSEKRV